MNGKVYLVGAGPGDYRLITLKGIDAIKKADVILYDRLANPKLLDYGRDGAELIYVGKAPNAHTLNQEEISRLILDKALEGKIVTRLKGGDPFVFGRGGEEAALLFENNVEFEIVPGITSAISVPAYAGIPVTHRNVSSSFHIITGHEDPTKEDKSLDYEVLGKLNGTLIFLMGIKNIGNICTNLIKNGQSPNRPVAVIRRGTTSEQDILKGTLETIETRVKETGFKNPAIIIVGEVVNLSEELAWFTKKPLFGKRVLVTRTRKQASKLSKLIEDLGGEAIEFPTIKIVENEDKSIDEYLKSVENYKWIIFTSVNGVKYFFERLKELKIDIRKIHGASLCAIGPATKDELTSRGFIVDHVPVEYRAEAIVDILKDKISAGDNILLPRADIARTLLSEELVKLGANVDNISIYKTVIPEENRNDLEDILINQNIDIITFTSSSTAKNFYKILGEDNLKTIEDKTIAAIGPITGQTVKELGLKLDIEASDYSIPGLVDAILEYMRRE